MVDAGDVAAVLLRNASLAAYGVAFLCGDATATRAADASAAVPWGAASADAAADASRSVGDDAGGSGGSVSLLLAAGGAPLADAAHYHSGSGTAFLAFLYVVTAEDAKTAAAAGGSAALLDAAHADALKLGRGWSIASASSGATTNARLGGAAAPGGAASLAASAALTLDGAAPTVVAVRCSHGFAEYGYGAGEAIEVCLRRLASPRAGRDSYCAVLK